MSAPFSSKRTSQDGKVETFTYSQIVHSIELDFTLGIVIVLAFALGSRGDIDGLERVISTMHNARSFSTAEGLDESAWKVRIELYGLGTLDSTRIPANGSEDDVS